MIVPAGTPHRPPPTLLKQVRVSACAFKNNIVAIEFVNEQPVWFNMTLTPILEITPQRMIPITFRQHFFIDECRQHLF